MGLTQTQRESPDIAGPLGSLAYSVVRARSPMLVVRALRWYRDLGRLGLHLPLFMIHDIGLLYAAPREQLDLEVERGIDLRYTGDSGRDHREYRGMLNEIAQSEASIKARSLRLGDDLIVVLLARLLASVATRLTVKAPYGATIPLDPSLATNIEPELPSLLSRMPRQFEVAALSQMARLRLFVLTMADAIDLDTLRLLGMLGPESSAAGALGHVDLLAAMSNPATNDIVNFSLELLPRILETHRQKSAGTHAVHGYAGVGSKGSIDSLVLTELAWDPDEFTRRMVENELLYYTREQASDEAKRLHYFLIDASASMRGDRQVFARGLAIALAKKLQLAGEEVWLRFFDSRLYEVHRAANGKLPAAYLLGFKGERGRNPARVFAQLSTEMALLRTRDSRDPVIHLLTHASLHVPRALVTELAKQAHLFGVFILPSGGDLTLDYLDLLEGHAVVDHATLSQKNARAKAAVSIVNDVATRTRELGPSSAQPTPSRRGGGEDAVPPSLRAGPRSAPPPASRG